MYTFQLCFLLLFQTRMSECLLKNCSTARFKWFLLSPSLPMSFFSIFSQLVMSSCTPFLTAEICVHSGLLAPYMVDLTSHWGPQISPKSSSWPASVLLLVLALKPTSNPSVSPVQSFPASCHLCHSHPGGAKPFRICCCLLVPCSATQPHHHHHSPATELLPLRWRGCLCAPPHCLECCKAQSRGHLLRKISHYSVPVCGEGLPFLSPVCECFTHWFICWFIVYR